MAVVLRRGKPVLWRELPLDSPEVEQPAIRRRFPADVVGDVGESLQRFVGGERRHHPPREAERGESGQPQAAFEDVATGLLWCHLHTACSINACPFTVAGWRIVPHAAPRTDISRAGLTTAAPIGANIAADATAALPPPSSTPRCRSRSARPSPSA